MNGWGGLLHQQRSMSESFRRMQLRMKCAVPKQPFDEYDIENQGRMRCSRMRGKDFFRAQNFRFQLGEDGRMNFGYLLDIVLETLVGWYPRGFPLTPSILLSLRGEIHLRPENEVEQFLAATDATWLIKASLEEST